MRAKQTTVLPLSSGTAIPLGALRTENSCCVGEYPDLIPFADFCKKASLSIIQLLPVNDTGTESSPYSALSAFALHPLYISISSLPEFSTTPDAAKGLTDIQNKYGKCKRFPYRDLRNAKLELLRTIYMANEKAITSSSELKNWIEANEWIQVYAVYMEHKRRNFEASWKEWKPKVHPSMTEIKALWNDSEKRTEHLFFAWVQMRADEQFAASAAYLKQIGVMLKGDIPIMMNEDSCDAWAYPEFFNDNLRAGSPPDGPNPCGQNWGFPIYNWDNLRRCDYSWWKQRLIQASKYYQIYRIDHVLGFFRIWATPQNETTAMLGWTQPFEPITKDELNTIGFNADRIRWLSKPHVPTRLIEEVNNNDYLGTHGLLQKIMDRIGNEELWLFKKEITGEKDIYKADLSDAVKERLGQAWRNRALIETSTGYFSPLWTYRDSTAWKSLNNEEQTKLGRLIADKQAKMEILWEKQAMTLLGELTKTTTMTACAEDLGSMPESVPKVLKDLNILSLRVVRWSREWQKTEQPFIPFKEYPRCSVTVSSVHDSSTLRLWWLKERDANDFLETFKAPAGIKTGEYTPKTAKYLLQTMATANSAFCIHPIQDYLGLVDKYYDSTPDDERVNIPGSVTAFNWTYRLPVNISTLAKDDKLISEIQAVVDKHTKIK